MAIHTGRSTLATSVAPTMSAFRYDHYVQLATSLSVDTSTMPGSGQVGVATTSLIKSLSSGGSVNMSASLGPSLAWSPTRDMLLARTLVKPGASPACRTNCKAEVAAA